MLPISGSSILSILKSKNEGIVNPSKKYVLAGRERHSSSRYMNRGYPQRVIRGKDFIYIWNIKPERWPAGAPQKYDPQNPEVLLPMYGLDENGNYIPDAAFTDIDDCPSKTFLIENYKNDEIRPYFDLALEKRAEVELYDIIKDPFCLNNLAGKPEFKEIEKEMKYALMKELKKSMDPRVLGPDTEIFDSYLRYSRIRDFPKPGWAQ